MYYRRSVLAAAIACATLSGCGSDSDDNTSNFNLSLAEGSALQLDINQALATVNHVNGSLDLSIGFGSGAFHMPGEEADTFYTLTDRGPNIKCSDSQALLGVDELCGTGNDAGKIFPVADFVPRIVKWQLTGSDGNYSAKVLETIELKKTDGSAVTGLTNDLTVTDTEGSFDITGAALAFDNSGMDPEALVKLADGSFWIAEEYGPSLAHISAEGEVLQRVVPASVAGDLADAGYPVTGVLPDIIKQRKLNRGIESLALAPDESALYFMLQSPLASPDAAAYKTSRHVRLFKFALQGGELGAQQGEWTYELDYPQTFASPDGEGDNSSKQSNVKVSEMLAVATDDLIVLERISDTTKLYRISLDGADNIMGTAVSTGKVNVNESADAKTLEQVLDLASVGARPVLKQLVFNSLTDMPQGTSLGSKIEGLAMLDDKHLLLINDNDFGIKDAKTELTILPLVDDLTATPAPSRPTFEVVGRYNSGVFDESAAEIVDYHANSQRLFVVNANSGQVDVLDLSTLGTQVISDATLLNNLSKVTSLDIQAKVTDIELGAANSVAVHGDLLAVAVENDDKQAPGIVAFYNLAGNTPSFMQAVTVGALPDMVIFTPDGSQLVVANEGEPNDDYTTDPEGSVSLIAITAGQPVATSSTVRFTEFNQGAARHNELPDGVRIFGPGATVAEDLEPEYIAVSADSQRAWVAMQENNALAEINLATGQISAIHALGTKDYGEAGNEIDASDKDDAINFALYPGLVGMYQPDSIAAYRFNDKDFVVSANEGDARDYDGYSEEERGEDLFEDNLLDAGNAQYSAVQNDAQLGRIKVTTATGDTDGDGDIDVIHNYGARSFSIWGGGSLYYDSRADIGKITAGILGDQFNGGDKRSDDKGAEPEALTLAELNGRTYAMVGLERTNGFMVYDITSPYGVQYLDYISNNNRDAEEESQQGDLGPEGMKFIPADKSPTQTPLLVVSSEVSGTTTVYQIK